KLSTNPTTASELVARE
nr:cytochrome-c reductase 53 kda subunit {P2 peptide} {EC 1.10.2.2.} [Solanum tuberosum=potatoes, Peptide Mitochondrial Partial, 16 aa] [Solanum tuberosum]